MTTFQVTLGTTTFPLGVLSTGPFRPTPPMPAGPALLFSALGIHPGRGSPSGARPAPGSHPGGLEGLPEGQAGQWLRAAWYLVLLIYHRREEREYTELETLIEEGAQASKFRLKEALETMGRSMAEAVTAKAMAEGRAEGLREALQTVLTRRFGEVPPQVLPSLAAADIKKLDDWLRRALEANTLAEVGIPGSAHSS